MPIISENNVYIAKSLIKASIKPDLVLTILQLKADGDTDPRTTCSCCSSAYQVERTIHIFEDRVYKFTYYNEGISYENMIGEVTHIECDPNYPDSGYVEVKAYLTEEDVERKVYANIKRIPISNIQNAIDITPYDSPIEEGDDYRLMILGISAQKVRALVINLKMINDNELDQAVKEVSLIVGNKYKVCYNKKDNILDCLQGTLTGMLEVPNLDQEFATGYNPNCGFVRECGECKYPEYNKYYLGDNGCDGCPIANDCNIEDEVSFYNNTYDKDRFLRLPENMISDVLLTFDTTSDTDTETVYTKIYLSQIRDVCDMYHHEDPASTDLEVEGINSTLFVTAKNSRIVAIKNGEYSSWDEADIKPVDVHAIYPNSYIPTMVNMYADGTYTILSEFTDDTRALKTIEFTRTSTTILEKIEDFVSKFNAWVVNHLCHNGDYTKPLINAILDTDNNIIRFRLNYYNINEFNNVGQIIKLLDPATIDDFLSSVVMKTLNTIDVNIKSSTDEFENIPVYDDGILSLEALNKYIKVMFTRAIEDIQNKALYTGMTYTLNDQDIFDFDGSEYSIHYMIKFFSADDQEDFEDKMDLVEELISFTTVKGYEIGFTSFSNEDVLVMEVQTHKVLDNYLRNISSNRRTAVNKFTIKTFLDIFDNIDILNDDNPFSIVGGELNITYNPETGTMVSIDDQEFNDFMIFIQKMNRVICHILCNLKNTVLYKNDNSKVQIVDNNKIFNMEPIDTSYEIYDPKGFYKLCKAFQNLFTDIMNETSMSKFDYSNSTTYTDSAIFNASALWNIGHIGSLTIPFALNYVIVR